MAHPGTGWHVPVARRRLVRRPRLVGTLPVDGVVPRLVLVCAPAGFGKTTLLAQWLEGWQAAADAAPRRVAWVPLETADDDPRRLLSDVVTALAAVVPGAGAEAAELLDGQVPQDVVLDSLLADLATTAGVVVLVLDDYHVVEAAEGRAAVAFLLDRLPANVSLALTTRADPALPLARLRARGELVELRAADLRFTTAEAVTFLNDVMGLALDEHDVEALQGRTEGWAAGLQLAALSLRGRDDASDAVERFTGSHRFVLDYLVEEVLDGCDDADRAFLLDTCVLDRMSGPLCDALTGGTDGDQRLEALDRANLFVVPLDDTRTWFRYHHLFADTLRARLAAADPDRMQRLHRAAAGWFADRGRPDTAIPHAVHGRDLELAGRLVERAMPDATRQRQDRTLRHWLSLLPDEVVRARPLLSVIAAWGRLAEGDVEDAQARLLGAEELLAAMPAEDRAGDDELRQLPMTIAVYRAAVAQARHDVPETARQARRILDLAGPADHLRRGAGHGFLGMALWADGDLPAAVDTFTACARDLRAAGNLADELGCAVPLGLMWWDRGRPDEARQVHERALAQAREHPAVARPVTADLHVGLAACLVERGDLAAADHHLATAQELGESASLPENRHRRLLAAARLRQAHGDLDAAAALLEEAQAQHVPGFFPEVRPVPALRARVDLARGRPDLARDWARRTGIASLEPSYRRECEHLTYVRLLLADGEQARAARLLAALLAAADGTGRDGSVVEILALDALALNASGRADEAVDRLGRALGLGVPAGYARLFLDEGAPMAAVLDAVEHRGAAARLVAVLRPGAAPAQDLPPDRRLSERELDVLRLLATELSGPEIAGRLFVSLNTLRTHTRHIFTKLDVTTRAAAVRRGGELRLL